MRQPQAPNKQLAARKSSPFSTTSNNPASSKPKKIPHKRLLFLLLLFVAAGSALLYHHHTQQLAINKERTQFTNATLSVDSLQKQLVTMLGQPVAQSIVQECTRPNLDLVTGPLSCETGQVLVYGLDGYTQAQSLTDKSNIVIQEQISPAAATLPNGELEFIELTSHSDVEEKSMVYTDVNSGLHCGIGYKYQYSSDPTNNYASLLHDHLESLVLDISCGSPAKAVYYPLKK